MRRFRFVALFFNFFFSNQAKSVPEFLRGTIRAEEVSSAVTRDFDSTRSTARIAGQTNNYLIDHRSQQNSKIQKQLRVQSTIWMMILNVFV